jgi:hypothetical protein
MLKHPILTFLLADAFMTGLFSTIRAFAPKNPEAEKEKDEDPGEDLAKSIENKEETV